MTWAWSRHWQYKILGEAAQVPREFRVSLHSMPRTSISGIRLILVPRRLANVLGGLIVSWRVTLAILQILMAKLANNSSQDCTVGTN